MFKHYILNQENKPNFTLNLLCMIYITMVILSIVLFDQILNFNFFGIQMSLSGSVVPYVFLYPISFIVLRVYGLKHVNNMIGAMILASLLFVVMAELIAYLSSNTTGIHTILLNSIKMYIAGFIGMPAGIYISFLVLNCLARVNIAFNTISLTIATIAGEIANTLIVFPIGFHGIFTSQEIFKNIIADALLFKSIMGPILSFVAIRVINFLINKMANQI